jgi:predicted secreted protein
MAEIIDLQGQQPQAPKFDPNKKYTWEYGAEFVLNGKDFGMILNALRAVINTKEAQTILLAKQAGDALEEVLEQAVNAGVVVELPENKASI